MTLDLPENLRQTADVLRNSLIQRAGERAPSMPAGLLEDLSARFKARESISPPVSRISLFGRIQSFVSTPAFGMAAAALVILTFALPSVLEPSGETLPIGFRGGSSDTGATASASIVLIGAPANVISSLGASGDFEKGSILTADTARGPKVIVDFDALTITSFSGGGQPVHTAQLPAGGADLLAAIAEALSKL